MVAHRMKKPLTIPQNLSDLAYAAGLVDGEGWVGIVSAEGLSGVPNHYVKVRIANCNLLILEWMHNHFGGAVHSQGNLKWRAENNRREGFNWELSGRDAARFLRAVSPFIVGKTKQVATALAMDELRRDNNQRHIPLTKREIKKRESLKSKMHVLNQRGI